MTEFKHVVFNPGLGQALASVIHEHTQDGLTTLRWCVPVTPYELVLVFGPPPTTSWPLDIGRIRVGSP